MSNKQELIDLVNGLVESKKEVEKLVVKAVEENKPQNQELEAELSHST